jgi:TolB-like protein/Flp pilus assembly protein TadD
VEIDNPPGLVMIGATFGGVANRMSFFEELKRRHVFKAALLYLVASWLILQVADVLFPNLGAPDWAFKLVLGLLILFFIPVLIFSWAYEITPGGLRRDREARLTQADSQRIDRRLNALIAILLALSIGGLALDRLVPETAPVAEGRTDVRQPPGPAEETDPQALAAAKFLDGLEPSIAVLPFVTRSDDRQDEYFSSGIHDDLLTQLAKIDGLKVISRTSVMQYAGTTKTIRQIAAELGVATVLEGGVQRAGERIRVNAQLIDARTDEHLWAESYDEQLTVSNIFLIQSRLATAIAGALQAELSPEVQARIDNQPTESLEAWDLELRARYLLDKEQSQPNLEGAVELFREAIALDPEYALAWAGLAQAVGELASWYYWPAETITEAVQAADRATELDPDLAQGYFSRGDLLRMGRRFDEAEAAFQRGLALSPGDADGHSRYGDVLRDAGRFEESLRESRRAIELDPRMVRIRVSLLQNLYFARSWDEVLAEAAEILQMEPDTAEAWYWIAFAESWKGNYAAVFPAAQKAVELDPDTPYLRAGLAYHYARSGQSDKAREMVTSPDALDWPLPEIGLVYGELGELDTAFEYMNRAIDEQPYGLFYLAVDPAADPLRGDPRWQDLVSRLKAD